MSQLHEYIDIFITITRLQGVKYFNTPYDIHVEVIRVIYMTTMEIVLNCLTTTSSQQIFLHFLKNVF